MTSLLSACKNGGVTPTRCLTDDLLVFKKNVILEMNRSEREALEIHNQSLKKDCPELYGDRA